MNFAINCTASDHKLIKSWYTESEIFLIFLYRELNPSWLIYTPFCIYEHWTVLCVYAAVSYTMDTIYFTWIDKPVDIERNLQLPQFALRGYVQNDCSQNYTGGQSFRHRVIHVLS